MVMSELSTEGSSAPKPPAAGAAAPVSTVTDSRAVTPLSVAVIGVSSTAISIVCSPSKGRPASSNIRASAVKT